MITHGNIVATAAAVPTIVPRLGNGDVYLAYLPLAHVLELAAEVSISELSFPMYSCEHNLGYALKRLVSFPGYNVDFRLRNRLWVTIDLN